MSRIYKELGRKLVDDVPLTPEPIPEREADGFARKEMKDLSFRDLLNRYTPNVSPEASIVERIFDQMKVYSQYLNDFSQESDPNNRLSMVSGFEDYMSQENISKKQLSLYHEVLLNTEDLDDIHDSLEKIDAFNHNDTSVDFGEMSLREVQLLQMAYQSMSDKDLPKAFEANDEHYVDDLFMHIKAYGDYVSRFAAEEDPQKRFDLVNDFENYVSENHLSKDELNAYHAILENSELENGSYDYDSIFEDLTNMDKFNKGDTLVNFGELPLNLIQQYQVAYQAHDAVQEEVITTHREVKDLIETTTVEEESEFEM